MVSGTLALGEVVSWSPPSAVDFGVFKQALAVSGLDVKLAMEMLPRNAFSRASHNLAENRIIRKVAEDASVITFQFTREWLDSNQEFQYAKESMVKLSKASGEIECDDAALANLVKSLVDAEIKIRRAADVTRLVQRIFDANNSDLVSIRESGGAYFVPQSQIEIVDRVSEFMKTVGGKLLRFAVGGGSQETSQSVAESMNDHFRKLVAEFRDSCENVTPETSATVIKRRRERIRELRFKLETFRGMLYEYADDISGAIGEAESDLNHRRDTAPVAQPEPFRVEESRTPEPSVSLTF